MLGALIRGRAAALVGAPRALLARAHIIPVAKVAGQAAPRRLCVAAAEAAAPAGETWVARLMREGQVDSGFWQGTAILLGVAAGVSAASDQQKYDAVKSLLDCYRSCGLKAELISDRLLVTDFVQKNVVASINVLMASPVFYFAFSAITGNGVVTSLMRSVTGTMRIVPFMGFFYAFFAVVCPFITAFFMERGQSYEEAQGTAGIVVMLTGLAAIEALVELRGCGVTFAQMTLSSFLLFIPALIGRLAAGVLTQQQKTGTASEPLLPQSWATGEAWQRQL